MVQWKHWFCCCSKTPWAKINLWKKGFVLVYSFRGEAHKGQGCMTAHAWNRKREIPSPSTHTKQNEQTTRGMRREHWGHTSSDTLPPARLPFPRQLHHWRPNVYYANLWGMFLIQIPQWGKALLCQHENLNLFRQHLLKTWGGRMLLEAQGLGFLFQPNWNSVLRAHRKTWSQKLQFYLSFLWWRQIPNVGFQPLHAQVHADVPRHGHACYTSQSQRMRGNRNVSMCHHVWSV